MEEAVRTGPLDKRLVRAGGQRPRRVTRVKLLLAAPGRLIAALFTLGSERWGRQQRAVERAGGYRELRICVCAMGVLFGV